MFFSFFVGGLLQLVFWPFATTFDSIIAFAALEGLFGSWSMVRSHLLVFLHTYVGIPDPPLVSTKLGTHLPSLSQSLIPSSAAQLFGMDGLATIVGFGVLANSPGQFLGATLSGLVLSSSGGWYPAVAFYAGSMMVGGALCLLYGKGDEMPASGRAEELTSCSCSALRQ